jgi:periplasmic protein TonB
VTGVCEAMSDPTEEASGERHWKSEPSAIAEERLPKRALLASFAGHAGILLALVLLALWGATPPPQERVLTVTLLNEGPGAAGAAGGNGGGGPAKTATNTPAAEPTKAAPHPAENPPPPSPSAANATAAPPKDQSVPVTLAAVPAKPLPLPPRRKPAPPPRRPAPRVAASSPPSASTPPPTPTPGPPQLAAAPAVSPAPGLPGQGSGPGGAVGVGAGAEGVGHGVLGSGPIEGPGDDYLDRLRRWLNRYKHYPEAAKKAKQQGHLVVHFTILRDGTVIDPRIEQSSGFPLLDEAALKMLRDASPVPPLPQRYHAAQLGVALPVDFSIGLLDRVF